MTPTLLLLGYALMMAAWWGGNPLFASPDETPHYYRALGLSQGQLLGTRELNLPADQLPRQGKPFDSQVAIVRWFAGTSRTVAVPPAKGAAGRDCFAFRERQPADCLYGPSPPTPTKVLTTVGTYQPFGYIAPAVGIALGADTGTAARFGRVASTAVCLALIAVAIFMLWDPQVGVRSLVGLLATMTPMVLFLSTVISPNGQEVAAAICLTAALLRLGRTDPSGRRPPAAAFLAAGMSGALLGCTRSLGPGFVLFAILMTLGIVGPRRMIAVFRRGGPPAAAAVLLLSGGAAIGVGWELAVQPHANPDADEARRGLVPAAARLTDALNQAVGRFGWLDTKLPQAAALAWIVLLLVCITMAVLAGRRLQRATLVAGIGMLTGGYVLLDALVVRQTGFAAQGRYLLPMAVAIPLVAGEVLNREAERLGAASPRHLSRLVGPVASCVLLVAWWTNARRYAVGTSGPIQFIGRSEWRPGGGWLPWLVLAFAGSAALLAAASGALDPRQRNLG